MLDQYNIDLVFYILKGALEDLCTKCDENDNFIGILSGEVKYSLVRNNEPENTCTVTRTSNGKVMQFGVEVLHQDFKTIQDRVLAD